MAAPPENCNGEEHRTIMKFLFQGKGAKQIHGETSQTLGNCDPSYAAVKCWVVNFKTAHFGFESEKPSGRPVSVSVPANVKAILIMEDRRISAKSIATYLGILCERGGSIIHNDLEIRKLEEKWIPKL